MKNLYGDDLKPCREPHHRAAGGSWNQATGQCDELGGGVHQICVVVNPKARDFSRQTGQSAWSEGRLGQNHCMCLGAYALHASKGFEAVDLKCDAIPAAALGAQYIGTWSTWNNLEQDNQIRDGVRRLVEACEAQAPSEGHRRHLRSLACDLSREAARQAEAGADRRLLAPGLAAALADLGCDGEDRAPPAISALQVGRLRDAYDDIFGAAELGRNRNAGGHRWATHILDRSRELDGDQLRALFTEYCPVSGSPVQPGRRGFAYSVDRATGRLQAADTATGHTVHHCCKPCICDLQDSAAVVPMRIELRGGESDTFDMLVLHKNPCKGKPDGILVEGAPAASCAGGRLAGARHPPGDDRPIIGMLQRSRDTEGGGGPGAAAAYCEARRQTGFRSGMGTMFRRVSGV